MTKRIIWANDDIELMDGAEEIFNDQGFEIVKCSSIAEALNALLAGESDNLLLDIDFPQNPKEGLVFLEQATIIDPELKGVMFTGHPELTDVVSAIKKMLASDYLSKPIPVDKERRADFFKKLHRNFDEPQS